MNRGIVDYYKNLMRTDEASESEAMEAFHAAIRADDEELLGLSLKRLPFSKAELDEESYLTASALREMASCRMHRMLVEHGYAMPSSPTLLPWNGSLEEVIKLMMESSGADRIKTISDLLHDVRYYLGVMSSEPSCFRVPFNINPEDSYKPYFFSYLDHWLSELPGFLEREAGHYDQKAVAGLISNIAENPELTGALEAFIDSSLFDRRNLGRYLNKAISHDNEPGFDLLIGYADDAALKEIDRYPRTSRSLLDKLFGMNVLIPGTDEAFEAFRKFIRSGKVDENSEEVLRAIMHPSYGDRRDAEGRTILFAAAFNKDFEPYLHPLLVTSSEELNARDDEGRTVLYHLARSGYPECLEPLVRMGAIPFCVDSEGSNVLHALIRRKWIRLEDITYCMSFLPSSILTMRNKAGISPIDAMIERFHRSVEEF